MGTDELQGFEEGDRVLFSDRARPLEVTDAGEGKLLVEGPQGGEYVIFPAPDDPDLLLVSKPGNREYASTVEDLRSVGRWERDGDRWEHTRTGATVAPVKNDAGNWTLAVDGIEAPDLPRYGFLEKDGALEEAEKLVGNNPEG